MLLKIKKQYFLLEKMGLLICQLVLHFLGGVLHEFCIILLMGKGNVASIAPGLASILQKGAYLFVFIDVICSSMYCVYLCEDVQMHAGVSGGLNRLPDLLGLALKPIRMLEFKLWSSVEAVCS